MFLFLKAGPGLPENSKRAHFGNPALQTPPKFTKGPQERERRKKIVAGGGKKKARNFGPQPFGPSTLRGPTLRGPHTMSSQNSTSKNWPKPKLAEVDRALSQTPSVAKHLAWTFPLVPGVDLEGRRENTWCGKCNSNVESMRLPHAPEGSTAQIGRDLANPCRNCAISPDQ